MTIQKPDKTHGWRGTADLWIDAGYHLLIDGGVEAVKVMPLARALGLSRTSFYWHFTDREALLDAIIDRWEAKNTGNLVARCNAPAGSICAAVFNLFDCWIDEDLFDSRFDLAIRNWAQNDEALMARVKTADSARLAAMRAMLERHGQSPAMAATRANTMIFTQVGYYTMRLGESVADRLERMPPYVKVFTDVTVATYANRFDGYSGETFVTLGTQPGPQNTLLVNTELQRPSDDPVALTYVIFGEGEDARIVDIYLDGSISELARQRSEYQSVMRNSGADALISGLDAKAKRLLSDNG